MNNSIKIVHYFYEGDLENGVMNENLIIMKSKSIGIFIFQLKSICE